MSWINHLLYSFKSNFFPHCTVASIKEGPTDTTGTLGGSVLFTCTATGIPLPTITWSSASRSSIEATGDMVINGTTRQSTLTLSNLQDDDFNKYTCTASNMVGSDNVTALLGSEYIIICISAGIEDSLAS